jgi:hypothetical protein
MASTYEKIATTTLGSATATVTFSSISSAYTDLILITADIINTTNVLGLYIQFNSDTGSNYSRIFMEGNGSSAASSKNSNQSNMMLGRSYGGDRTTNIFQIQNYSNSTTNKTTLCRYGSGGSSSAVGAAIGLWRNTNAITSITIGIEGGYNMSAGCSFALYGIKAA